MIRVSFSDDWFYSRKELDDPRLGDVVKAITLEELAQSEWDWVLIGFPDDRGIVLNQGRPGAGEGPNAVRRAFYRLVPPWQSIRIADLGNLVMTESLTTDHSAGSYLIAQALASSRRVAVIGGGHDWGFAPIDAQAHSSNLLAKQTQKKAREPRVGFINFDAHLDVRVSNIPHSGTPFWRALETHIRGEDALWFGVQASSLARTHREYVVAKGGRIYLADADLTETRKSFLRDAMSLLERCDGVDVSLDMDVFKMAEAPGVSAPQPLGLEAREVVGLLREILRSHKVRTFGVYETSPPHDPTGITSRLAARCLWESMVTLTEN
ncbi:MAG: formimidoylglutamase [Candidatus Caldarchaeum sp.]